MRAGDAELAQELANGSMIFLGGWEAALAVCEGGNPLSIRVLVDTRDGRSEFQARDGSPHTMVAPEGVKHLKVPASRLARWVLPADIEKSYGPLFQQLAVPQTNMLVHCKNGRHRSAQVVSGVVLAISDGSADDVMNFICLRRAVAEFHALQGPQQHFICVAVHFRGHEPHHEGCHGSLRF